MASRQVRRFVGTTDCAPVLPLRLGVPFVLFVPFVVDVAAGVHGVTPSGA
jgi:hypothetical protein